MFNDYHPASASSNWWSQPVIQPSEQSAFNVCHGDVPPHLDQ
jgi:hypothetical protein